MKLKQSLHFPIQCKQLVWTVSSLLCGFPVVMSKIISGIANPSDENLPFTRVATEPTGKRFNEPLNTGFGAQSVRILQVFPDPVLDLSWTAFPDQINPLSEVLNWHLSFLRAYSMKCFKSLSQPKGFRLQICLSLRS